MTELESDRAERTESTTNTEKFCEAVCAFANDFPRHGTPGYLLVGVDDAGRACGLTVTDEILRSLSDIRSAGNVLPQPAMTVARFSLEDGDVAVIEVYPSDLPPVRYKGRVWIRVGPRKAIANETEERLLLERRTAAAMTFDAVPCAECTLSDLALDVFKLVYLPSAVAPDVVAENHRDIRAQLASLRFYDVKNDAATYAGCLLLAKDPLRYISGAYVQYVRYRGYQMDDVLEEKRFAGDLLTVLREMDRFVQKAVQTRPQAVTVLREETVRDYPPQAIRELLMNAVMHRSYQATAPIRFYWFDDRIEIQSPGGLYGEATPENFPRQNAYRNPIVAEAMKVLGFVNKFGQGVVAAQRALERNGNPQAQFTFDPHYFLVTVRRRP